MSDEMHDVGEDGWIRLPPQMVKELREKHGGRVWFLRGVELWEAWPEKKLEHALGKRDEAPLFKRGDTVRSSLTTTNLIYLGPGLGTVMRMGEDEEGLIIEVCWDDARAVSWHRPKELSLASRSENEEGEDEDAAKCDHGHGLRRRGRKGPERR